MFVFVGLREFPGWAIAGGKIVVSICCFPPAPPMCLPAPHRPLHQLDNWVAPPGTNPAACLAHATEHPTRHNPPNTSKCIWMCECTARPHKFAYKIQSSLIHSTVFKCVGVSLFHPVSYWNFTQLSTWYTGQWVENREGVGVGVDGGQHEIKLQLSRFAWAQAQHEPQLLLHVMFWRSISPPVHHIVQST